MICKRWITCAVPGVFGYKTMPKCLRCRPNQLHSLKQQNMDSTGRFFRVHVPFLVFLWDFHSYVNTLYDTSLFGSPLVCMVNSFHDLFKLNLFFPFFLQGLFDCFHDVILLKFPFRYLVYLITFLNSHSS
jgi:hypothetical protein